MNKIKEIKGKNQFLPGKKSVFAFFTQAITRAALTLKPLPKYQFLKVEKSPKFLLLHGDMDQVVSPSNLLEAKDFLE